MDRLLIYGELLTPAPSTEDAPMRDWAAFLAVARLLPLDQRIAIVLQAMSLLQKQP